MYKTGQEAPVPSAPNPLTNANPLTTGLQMGMVGGAAGVGWAAIHQAIRNHAGNKVPVDSIKPMIIGALIGTALGTTAGFAGRGKGYAPRSPTWGGVEEEIGDRAGDNVMTVPAQSAYKYAGLRHIADKHAMQKYGQSVLGTTADIGTYFIPGVGQARMGYDTLSSLGGMASQAFKGNWRQAGGHLLSGLGNAGMFAASLIPGGQFLAGAAKAMRAGRLLSKGRKLAPVRGLTQNVGRDIGARMPAGIPLRSMQQAGGKMKNMLTGRQATALGLGSLPLGITGGVIEGMPETAPRSFVSPSRPWRMGPTAMPNIDYESLFQKRSQADDYGSMIYEPALASKTLMDLYLAIRADAGVDPMQKLQLINQVRALTGNAGEGTPLSALMIKGLGGTIGWLISKYFKMGPIGQLWSAAGGFGIGSVINNELNKPPNPYPGYRALGA